MASIGRFGAKYKHKNVLEKNCARGSASSTVRAEEQDIKSINLCNLAVIVNFTPIGVIRTGNQHRFYNGIPLLGELCVNGSSNALYLLVDFSG